MIQKKTLKHIKRFLSIDCSTITLICWLYIHFIPNENNILWRDRTCGRVIIGTIPSLSSNSVRIVPGIYKAQTYLPRLAGISFGVYLPRHNPHFYAPKPTPRHLSTRLISEFITVTISITPCKGLRISRRRRNLVLSRHLATLIISRPTSPWQRLLCN